MKNLKKKTYKLLVFFCSDYGKSLFTSLRAFLPSFRVLKANQEREEIIRKVSVNKEIKVLSIFQGIN